MGQKVSTPPIDIRTRELILQYNISDFEIYTLWKIFVKLDEDRNGFWTLNECFRLVEESRTSVVAPMLEALFFLASSGNDSTLYFEDFLVSFTSFCALSKEEVLQFMFMVIDFDRNGTLTKRELGDFLRYKASGSVRVAVFPPNNLEALEKFNEGVWARLNFDEFALLCDRFPFVSFCSFHLQELLREGLLGLLFWQTWDEERLRVFHMESESKQVTATKTLADGRVLTVVKPGRFSMKEILEFTKRRSAMKKAGEDFVAKGLKKDEGVTRGKDVLMALAPLLNIVRNRRCAYYINAETEEERKMREKLIEEEERNAQRRAEIDKKLTKSKILEVDQRIKLDAEVASDDEDSEQDVPSSSHNRLS